MVTLYGIRNCDTVKKARLWLDSNNIAYTFHDFQKEGLDKATLDAWIDELGLELLLNKRGTTWRRLPESDTQALDRQRATNLMLNNLSVIKRPVLNHAGQLRCGFNEAQWAPLLTHRE